MELIRAVYWYIYRIPVFYVRSDYRIACFCIGQHIDNFYVKKI